MSTPLLLKGGIVIDPSQGLHEQYDVLIANGLIKAIERNITPPDGTQVIDVSNKLVTPGLVDLHVHLRDLSEEHKETIGSGTSAAVAGGFTTVCCMPNTAPPLDNVMGIGYILWKAHCEGHCRVLPVGAVSVGMQHEMLTEMARMHDAGAVAFSDDGYPIQNSGFLRRVLEYAHVCDVPVMLHCEDKSLTEGGVMNAGYMSMALGLRGMPSEAEAIAVFRAIQLARSTNTPVHIQHVSTAGAVELIRMAKEDGVSITAEVTPHHLVLTERAIAGYNTACKINPPLRTDADVDALREALRDGVIDAIATDHAPHAQEDKEVEFDAAAFGAIGLETAVGVIFSELIHKGTLSIEQAIERLSTTPARVLGIDAGTLRIGSRADVTVIDPDAEWVVNPEEFRSKARNTPFANWKLRGRVTMTIVNGSIAYQVASAQATASPV